MRGAGRARLRRGPGRAASGHIPFLVVLRPNVPVRPATLFVNKAEVREEPHATISWGAGEAGIAEGVREAIKAGALAGQDLDTLAIIVSIWIDPAVTDAAAVLQNTRAAMRLALLRADGKPLTRPISWTTRSTPSTVCLRCRSRDGPHDRRRVRRRVRRLARHARAGARRVARRPVHDIRHTPPFPLFVDRAQGAGNGTSTATS